MQQPSPQQPQQQQQPPQPQQQQQKQQQPRQQVTVNAALDTLCTMFESVDRDVVHMILIEGCGGNMESAVEALLTMTGGISGQQQPQKPPSIPSSPTNKNKNNQSGNIKSSVNLPEKSIFKKKMCHPLNFNN